MRFYVGDIVALVNTRDADHGPPFRVQHDEFYWTPNGLVPIWREPFVIPRYVNSEEVQLIWRPWINRFLSLFEP